MESLKIITDRLIITELDESMAEVVHLNSLDEDNRRFVPDEVFETVQEALDTINFLTGCYENMDGPLVYAVLLKNGDNIGYVQAVPIDNGWEIGYHIASNYTRNGYATEAVKAFLPIIMKRLDIERIWGICHGDNMASRRVLEKCSFNLVDKYVGDYKGENCDICKYVYENMGSEDENK
jgi:RimJ/RimL family protein N-acetyltransferase